MSETNTTYYVPHSSYWPIVGSVGLFASALGIINWLHGVSIGPYLAALGFATITFMMFGWFGAVINESLSGKYRGREDKSFRMGMAWFIFSEVCFFAAFFGALFYARIISVAWLGGDYASSSSSLTNLVLWPDFKAVWPLLMNPDNTKFIAPSEAMPAWGIPALNTMILLTSGLTLTWAHWGLQKNKRAHLILGLLVTVMLGVLFLVFQAYEYMEAYHEMGLTLDSGIYGTTFFMLTGFHGMHVTIGAIMLTVMLLRSMRGHFTPENHFAFEATAWYWHFVDVVWLLLFVFVYWL